MTKWPGTDIPWDDEEEQVGPQPKGFIHPNDKKHVHVVGGSTLVKAMFAKRPQFKLVGLFDAEIVCFTGGEDVSPSLYGDNIHPLTHPNEKRDIFEKRVYDLVRELQQKKKRKILMVGICRGAQLLNVLNGGTLYQHVTDHNKHHEMSYERLQGHVQTVIVSSTHHQMMIPTKEGIMWGRSYVSKYRAKGGDTPGDIRPPGSPDPEVVFYPKTRSLCFQPHPEYVSYPECTAIFFHSVYRAIVSEDNPEYATCGLSKVLLEDPHAWAKRDLLPQTDDLRSIQ